jgi:hypothetical protein
MHTIRALPAENSFRLEARGASLLFQDLHVEIGEFFRIHSVADLNRIAADLAVFHISLSPNGEIEDHRDFLPAIRTCEEVFHIAN